MRWNELAPFDALRGPFIIRDSEVHCAEEPGGLTGDVGDNAALGQFGRVWVRDSLATPSLADLPACDASQVSLGSLWVAGVAGEGGHLTPDFERGVTSYDVDFGVGVERNSEV